MDNNKKKMIFIIIIVAIVAIVLLEVIIGVIRKNSINHPDEPITDETINDIETKNCVVNTIEDFSNFETIRNCIYTYYQSYVYTNSANVNPDEDGNSTQYYKDRLYGLLAKEYIEKNSITKDSIVCNKTITNFDVDILELYQVSKYNESVEDYGMTTLYIVEGVFRNTADKSFEKFNMALLVDNINMTYEIYPSDYVDIAKYTTLKEGDKIEFTIPTSVEKNEYNKFSIYSTSLDDYARYNFRVIRNLLLYNTDIAFEHLTEDGKASYASVGDLTNFVNENRSSLATMNYSSNAMNVKDGVLSLDCYDSNYKYKVSMTFNGYSTFKYSIEKVK